MKSVNSVLKTIIVSADALTDGVKKTANILHHTTDAVESYSEIFANHAETSKLISRANQRIRIEEEAVAAYTRRVELLQAVEKLQNFESEKASSRLESLVQALKTE